MIGNVIILCYTKSTAHINTVLYVCSIKKHMSRERQRGRVLNWEAIQFASLQIGCETMLKQ